LLIVGDEVYDNQIKQPFKLSSQEADRYLMLATVNKTHS
jgi:hypothetical protein